MIELKIANNGEDAAQLAERAFRQITEYRTE
jgi:hypothetical protein